MSSRRSGMIILRIFNGLEVIGGKEIKSEEKAERRRDINMASRKEICIDR